MGTRRGPTRMSEGSDVAPRWALRARGWRSIDATDADARARKSTLRTQKLVPGPSFAEVRAPIAPKFWTTPCSGLRVATVHPSGRRPIDFPGAAPQLLPEIGTRGAIVRCPSISLASCYTLSSRPGASTCCLSPELLAVRTCCPNGPGPFCAAGRRILARGAARKASAGAFVAEGLGAVGWRERGRWPGLPQIWPAGPIWPTPDRSQRGCRQVWPSLGRIQLSSPPSWAEFGPDPAQSGRDSARSPQSSATFGQCWPLTGPWEPLVAHCNLEQSVV